MKKYKVLNTVNLTVDPGSIVFITSEQYIAAKNYLVSVEDAIMPEDATPLVEVVTPPEEPAKKSKPVRKTSETE